MKEIDVALTDYGLTILCCVIAFTLIRTHAYDRMLNTWFSMLFLSVGLASGIGGTVHGFVHEDTLLHSILWRVYEINYEINLVTLRVKNPFSLY